MEPKRWLDGASDAPVGAREILGAAQPIAPMTEAMRGRLSLYMAKTMTLPKAVTWSWLGAKGVMAVGLVAAAGYGAARLSTRVAAQSVEASTSSMSLVRGSTFQAPPSVETVTVQEAEPLVTASPGPIAAPRRLAKPSANAPRIAAAAPAIVAAAAEPPDEIDYLERARSLLASDPQTSLRLVDRHHDVFPAGKLDLEAELIAVQALDRQGQRKAARARADRMIASHPGSIYAERLRRLFDSSR